MQLGDLTQPEASGTRSAQPYAVGPWPTEDALHLVWSLARGTRANAMSYDMALIQYPQITSALQTICDETRATVDIIPAWDLTDDEQFPFATSPKLWGGCMRLPTEEFAVAAFWRNDFSNNTRLKSLANQLPIRLSNDAPACQQRLHNAGVDVTAAGRAR